MTSRELTVDKQAVIKEIPEADIKAVSEWWVYIIETRSGKLYTGITTDIERRFSEHSDQGSKKGAKFFRTDPPVKVVHSESAANRSEASKREASIKKLRRPQKMQLIMGC